MKNISEFLTSVKMDLGIYGITLPFPDENKTLMDVVKLKTLKTFNQFYPHIIRLDLKLDDFKLIKNNYTECIYEIPDIFGGREILYVRKVEQRNKLLGSGYLNPLFDESLDMYNSLMMAQAGANLMSTAVPSFTFKFLQPNLLYLYNMSTMASEVTIEFAVEHFENLASIPNTAWHSFEELALLDIKQFLYGVLKRYDSLQTAHGTINLHIDDWSGAEAERKDLIEKWRDVYHLETEQFFII
jgi:hypothetical protein